MRTVAMTKLSYRELEEILNQHFPGVDPDLVAREEWNNDEEHSFTVDTRLDEYDTKKLASYIAGEWTKWGTTGVLLNALCLKGVIPSGEYLIDVSW